MPRISFRWANFFHNSFNIVKHHLVDFKIKEHGLKSINKNVCGIYCFYNTKTGDRYIGQSINISARLTEHLSLLRHNRHLYKDKKTKTLLQKAWNKYGEDAFDLYVVEYCNKGKLNEREIYWIDHYKCNRQKHGKGYNLTDGGEYAFAKPITDKKGTIMVNNGSIQKAIRPEELDEYLRNGFSRGILQKYIEKRKHVVREKKPKIKKIQTEEERRERYRKVGLKLRGRKISEESILKAAMAKMKPVIQLSKDGEFIKEFASGKQAELETGISRSHICQCCNGKRKTSGGYRWRFKDE